jgi:hypothetical protein
LLTCKILEDFETSSPVTRKKESIVSIFEIPKLNTLDPDVETFSIKQSKKKLRQTLSCFDRNSLTISVSSPRIKDLVFHKIQKTEGANIIDPLAMDSFNRNAMSSRDFGYHRPCVSNKFEFFIDKNEFIKNLKNNFPNLKNPIKNKIAKKTIYLKSISKNNLKSKLTIL